VDKTGEISLVYAAASATAVMSPRPSPSVPTPSRRSLGADGLEL